MSKYNAVRTQVDGIWFASKRESKRYSELKTLERFGQILDLELQPKFPVFVQPKIGVSVESAGAGVFTDAPVYLPKSVKVFTYIADFRYRDKDTGRVIVEDSKGMRTQVYRLKKKCVEAYYGIRISEV